MLKGGTRQCYMASLECLWVHKPIPLHYRPICMKHPAASVLVEIDFCKGPHWLSFDSFDEHPVLRCIGKDVNEIQTYNCANIHCYLRTLERVWEAVCQLVKLLPILGAPAEALESIDLADVSCLLCDNVLRCIGCRLIKKLLVLTDNGSYFVLSAS